ncbi:MAG: hypothetical protein A07HR60_00533 [uncultured archaeon A07HR60]|nr:MAG: hypothetical protein A07HR60_00533 [uncultured archaeon A07HR60]
MWMWIRAGANESGINYVDIFEESVDWRPPCWHDESEVGVFWHGEDAWSALREAVSGVSGG